MGMVAILFNDAEPFKQSVNIIHVKSGENWSSDFREEDV